MIQMFTKKRKKGFTLIELIVVIAILGILMVIAIPRFSGFTEKAKIGNDEQYAALIANATNVMVASGDVKYAEDAEEIIISIKADGSIESTEGMAYDRLEDETAYQEELNNLVSQKELQSKKYSGGMKVATSDSGVGEISEP